MITLTVKNLKTGKTSNEVYFSKDKAESRLDVIKESKDKLKLVGASYDTDSEKRLVSPYLGKKPKEEDD